VREAFLVAQVRETSEAPYLAIRRAGREREVDDAETRQD